MTLRRRSGMLTEAGNADVKVTARYKSNQIGFEWTNAIYLKLTEMISGK